MPETPATDAARPLRADKARNRAALIAAAQDVFAQEGLDASMERVAARAGVGVGTLYRHFASRAELWVVVLEEPLKRHLALVEGALAEADPWIALRDYLEAACAAEADRAGYSNLLTTDLSISPQLLPIRSAIQRGIERLVRRARASGVVRSDFAAEDLMFLTVSNSRVIELTRDIAPNAWRRNLALFLDAIRPREGETERSSPMTARQVYEVMVRPR